MGLGISSCGKSDANSKPKGGPSRKPRVTQEVVTEREVEFSIEAVGSLEAKEEISIPARVAGPIDTVHFKEGDPVSGQRVLVEIDVERYRLAEARAKADVDRAEAQRNLAQKLYENRLKLQAAGKKQDKQWVTDEQMATWEADLKKAEADLAKAQADHDLAKRNHLDARVKSPISGVIHRKSVSKGEYVKAETVVATILDLSSLYVRFTVPGVESSRLKKDLEIRFWIRNGPEQGFRARLFYLGQKLDEKTRALECKGEVLDRTEILRPGVFATVKIVTEKKKRIVIPDRAALPTEKGFVVFTIEEGKAKSHDVELGLRTEDGVEVVRGLHRGDTIVVDGGASLQDDVEVEIVEKR